MILGSCVLKPRFRKILEFESGHPRLSCILQEKPGIPLSGSSGPIPGDPQFSYINIPLLGDSGV